MISAWFAKTDDGEDCWGNLMHSDSSQKMDRLSPVIATAKNYWHIEASKLSYPMSYHIQISKLDVDLNVKCTVNDLELYFDERPDLNHYEGAAQVTGTCQGNR